MFHKPSVRLAGLYLAILMAISLFFSVLVYQLSVQELGRGLRGPQQGMMRPTGPGFSNEIRNELINQSAAQLDIARDRILMRLVAINAIILVSGGFLSYYLAVRTLRPIEAAHDAQSRFTADASHELRTPITAMRSENEVALMNPKLSLADAKLQLQSNIEELEKLTQLSEGLLRLAQVEHADIPRAEVSIDAITDAAIQRVTIHARSKKITISVTPNSVPKLATYGNMPSLIESMVILLDNAIKYSNKKSTIEVTVAKKQKQAHISIADHGIGIKSDEIDYIFDRFYRADASRSRQGVEGYGLGLAIAKNIITMHEGSISATSVEGVGSQFIIRLPLKN